MISESKSFASSYVLQAIAIDFGCGFSFAAAGLDVSNRIG
jgi:hypothetical protein